MIYKGGKMKNNFYHIPEEWYKELNMNFNIGNNMLPTPSLNNNLSEPTTAFLRGNLFDNLYDQYKNYKYGMLNPTNKKEELLYNIMMYKFILTELNLYLDNYPNDTQKISLYNQYLKEEKILCNEYEKQYGPLTTDSMNLKNNSWDWIQSPWPWEGKR